MERLAMESLWKGKLWKAKHIKGKESLWKGKLWKAAKHIKKGKVNQAKGKPITTGESQTSRRATTSLYPKHKASQYLTSLYPLP